MNYLLADGREVPVIVPPPQEFDGWRVVRMDRTLHPNEGYWYQGIGKCDEPTTLCNKSNYPLSGLSWIYQRIVRILEETE
jgi:hypothetical protein